MFRAPVARIRLPIILFGVSRILRLSRPVEKRRYRRWSGEDAPFRVRCATSGAYARLVDFSHSGLGLVMPDATPVASRAVAVVLSSETEAFARVTVGVAVRSWSAEGLRIGGPILACEAIPFGTASAPGEGDLAELREASLRREVLERLHAQAPPLLVAFDDGEVACARVDATAPLVAGLAVVVLGPLGRAPGERVASIAFDLDGGAFAIRGPLVPQGGGRFVLAPPFAVTSLARRRADRVRLEAGRGVMTWSSPLVPGERIVADVEDLSHDGARVRVRRGDSTLPPPPGEPAMLHVDGLALPVRADLRHVDGAPGDLTFGLRFIPESSDDTLRLAREVERIRFPGLRPRRTRSRDDVLALLQASGYLDLRESARDVAPWHDAAEAGLSLDSVHVDVDGALDGHLSTTRIYSNTWVFHQLATLQGPRAMRCRRALYLSATSWVSTLSSGTGHAMAYFDRKKRWHARFFGAFVAWAGSEALAQIVPVDRFEVAGDAEPLAADPAIEAGDARPEELARVQRAIDAAMPPLLREAMDLRADRLVTGALSPEHVAEGLPRARSVLVARERGEAVAYALCETGSRSMSLFNLLNVAYLLVAPGASDEAQRTLVARVRDFYATRGTPQPILCAMPGTLTAAAAAGLALAETMGCMVLSPEGLRQYRNFLAFSLRDLAG
jgi:hypothetical protein